MSVIWTQAALNDLRRIFEFNALYSIERAQRVDARLAARAEALADFPLLGRVIPRSDLRSISVPDIQYVMLYRVRKAGISIVQVYSTRENRP